MGTFRDLAFTPQDKVAAITFSKEWLTCPTALITALLQLGSCCKPMLVQMSATSSSLENHRLGI